MNRSRLLRLPAELRHLIYEFLFGHLEYEMETKGNGSFLVARYRHQPRAHTFALLRVSRQIYAETSLLPCNLATFHFYNKSLIDVFFHALSSQQAAAVRKVCFVVKFVCWDTEGVTWEPLVRHYPEVWLSLVGVVDLHLLVERIIEGSPPMKKLVTLLLELREEVQKQIPRLTKLTFASYRDNGDGWDVAKEMEERTRALATI